MRYHGMKSAGSDLRLNSAGSDLGLKSAGSDLRLKSAGSDLGLNSDLRLKSVGSDLGLKSAGSDLGLKSAGSDLGLNSDLGLKSAGSDLGLNSAGSDLGLNSDLGLKSAGNWCYTAESCGPSTWSSLGSCNGSQQSPINITEDTAQFNGSLSPFNFTNYNNATTLLTMDNTGRTVEVSIGSGVSVSGGGLPAVYSAIAFHFHWGNGTSGSEHRLSGKQYPMEMHIVHTKNGMNLTDAKKDRTGIAVLGFFIDIMDSANTSQLSVISNLLNQVSTPGTMLVLNSTFSLDSLLGDVNRIMYYRYLGSLTTPTCDEAVVWTVFKNPIYVPSYVVKSFSSALNTSVSGVSTTMMNNFRPPQSLNGRQVQASFKSSLSANSTSTPNITNSSSSGVSLQSTATLSIVISLLLLSLGPS
ncbi:carbonic anhydrase 15-like [Mixophyes fleayi]|uniref:carbonic anhydrase 15-like n=1 Tax=Mixophyes fleayi TaxID=3061075 RepID=UPI003F4DD51E